MDLFDTPDLRNMDPSNPSEFKRRWEIMIAWKFFRNLEDPRDPFLISWEAEQRINFGIILSRTVDAIDYDESVYAQFRYPDSPSRDQCICLLYTSPSPRDS